MGSRYLTQPEVNTAFTVFEHTVPYSKVVLNSGLGVGNRPFTIPAANPGYYIIYIGPQVRWHTLIHELTHVWQGHNYPISWGYVLDSLLHQLCGDAYDYELGLDWRSYSAEQQAQLVEDWFKRGRSTDDAAYPYIRDHLRKGDAGFRGGDFDHITI